MIPQVVSIDDLPCSKKKQSITMSQQLARRASAWKCPACSAATQHSRTLASSAIHSQQIGPESPKYIDLPRPFQEQHIPHIKKKGFLPVSRDIFEKRRGGVGKVTSKYLAAATQQAQKPLGSTNEEQAAFNDWRTRMAVSRKENLREGLKALQQRRIETNEYLARRGAEKHIERQALLEMKEREDERLTGPTIHSVMKAVPGSSNLPDPDRAERVADMVARVQAKEARRVDQRQDALHTLYMNAKNFIITEPQLDQHIEKVFGTTEQPIFTSIWVKEKGPPPTTTSRLNRGKKGVDSERNAEIMVTRIGKIAEALTGGKGIV